MIRFATYVVKKSSRRKQNTQFAMIVSCKWNAKWKGLFVLYVRW